MEISDAQSCTIYGYARASTDAQDLTNQVTQLKAAGCATTFREKISGATADRPQLKKLMARLAAGDVVMIPAVDRLSRDTTDLLVIAREIQRAGRDCARFPNPSSIPRPTSPNWCSPCSGLPPSWSVAAS
jgi:predicted site-specific integrase-resolvase